MLCCRKNDGNIQSTAQQKKKKLQFSLHLDRFLFVYSDSGLLHVWKREKNLMNGR
jgi:hypothetical protein